MSGAETDEEELELLEEVEKKEKARRRSRGPYRKSSPGGT
jgi:hypothetical protein